MTKLYSISIKRYNSPEEMATQLTDNLNLQLIEILRLKDKAFIIFPGGSTPQLLIKKLAYQKIDWDRVVFATTDERCVSDEDPHSNIGQLRKIFFEERKIFIHTLPLLSLEKINQHFRSDFFWPSDITIVGMGDDGHIASLFPGQSTHDYSVLDDDYIIKTTSPKPPYHRVSLTMERLCCSNRLLLILHGKDKERLLESVLNGENAHLPLARFIKIAQDKLEVHIADNKESEDL